MDRTISVDMSKAGMQSASSDDVSKIMNDASRGTPFYEREAQRAKERLVRINALKASVEDVRDELCSIGSVDYYEGTFNQLRDTTDEKERGMWGRCLSETTIPFSRVEEYLDKVGEATSVADVVIPSFFGVFAHLDLDMFFAAVEEKLNPDLQGIPFAVGGMSMLSTSNYEARKYGVRAAMPGYLAKKLCPSLVIVHGSYKRYEEESDDFKSVVREVDPNFQSWGLDETSINLLPQILLNRAKRGASLDVLYNLPEFLEEGSNIVADIRAKIKAKTSLTASGGIAVSRSIAKIMSNRNKPNGQFTNVISKWNPTQASECVVGHIHDTISPLKCRDISGIGKVSDEFLQAFGILTVGDLYLKRYLVQKVLTPKTADTLLLTSLGLMGSGNDSLIEEKVTDDSKLHRKSLAVDRTFFQLDSKEQLLSKCNEIIKLALERLAQEGIGFKQVTLRLKQRNYEVHQYTKSFPLYVSCGEEGVSCPLSGAVKELLKPFEDNFEDFRLLGVRVGHLCQISEIEHLNKPVAVKTQSRQLTLDQFAKKSEPKVNRKVKPRGRRSRSPTVIEIVDDESVEILD